MEKFEINILGCGAAVPTARHMTTAQLVNIHDKMFLVDCGEGTQTQIWKSGIRVTNMNHIFISHAHGDHFFGLIPLLSSMRLMLERTDAVHVYVPEGLKESLEGLLNTWCNLSFPVIIHTHDGKSRTVLYEDDELTVETIPLQHTVPCSGFLFCEKPKRPVLLPEKCLSYGISLRDFNRIKNGEDYVLADGTVVPNSELTTPSPFVPRSYAFCSDTAYSPDIVSQLDGIDLLYHEATFTADEEAMAAKTLHSTTIQAAEIAKAAHVGKLIIGHYSVRYAGEHQHENEARQVFPNSVACQEGMTFQVEKLSEEETEANMSVLPESPVTHKKERAKETESIVVQNGLRIDRKRKVVTGADDDVKEVVIPQEIESVGALAFKNLKSLRRIVIHEGVSCIGKAAFQGCSSLQSVIIPTTIDEIREMTFKDCVSLAEVTVPEGVTDIGKWAFRGCLSLRHASLPSTLKSIGIGAFQDCAELSQLTLPAGLEHLQLNAFKGCKALDGTLIIPSGCLDFEGRQVSTDNNND